MGEKPLEGLSRVWQGLICNFDHHCASVQPMDYGTASMEIGMGGGGELLLQKLVS